MYFYELKEEYIGWTFSVWSDKKVKEKIASLYFDWFPIKKITPDDVRKWNTTK